MKKLKLFFLVSFLFCNTAFATDYYFCDCSTGADINCSAGSDANDGLSHANAKQTEEILE